MKLPLLLTAAVVTAATLTTCSTARSALPASARTLLAHRALPAPTELRLATVTVKHARDVLAFLAGNPTAGTARSRARIGRDYRWLLRFATARAVAARERLQPLYPPHHTLWLCIHSGEGSWGDHDSGGNGHYGGLQMHWSWGYGIVGDAGNYSEAAQEWAAERGYQASGYRSTFLWQQWAADARCFS